MTKRIDVAMLERTVGTLYPPPFDQPCRPRERTRLGDPAGLTQFGVNLVRLKPGAASSQRHWHENEDEFLIVLEGELVLVLDNEEVTVKQGDFVINRGVNHAWSNQSGKPAAVAIASHSAR